jgi:outer membrane receptor for ferrienterochelin and colicin
MHVRVLTNSPDRASSRHQEFTALEEVIVIGLAEQLVATRTATQLREIPQSIAIVTREHLREQNSLDLGDVLSRAPGIKLPRSAPGENS